MMTATLPDSIAVLGVPAAKQASEPSAAQQADELDLAALSRVAGGMNKNDLIADTSTRPARA